MSLFKRTGMWRDVSPTGMIADFMTVWNQAGRNRWRIAAVSAACTFALFSFWAQEEYVGPKPMPKVDYITTFESGRSDREILESNIANQKLQDQLAAEQAERDEKVREMYKSLGRISGMDVEKAERKYQAERAAKLEEERKAEEAAAERSKIKEAMERLGVPETSGE